MRVGKSDLHGYGLFATMRVPAKTILCRYTGVRVRVSDSKDKDWLARLDKVHAIDSSDPHNEGGRWANHSLDCNSHLIQSIEDGIWDGEEGIWFLYVISTRDIEIGCEITVNYGIEYFEKEGVIDPVYYTGLPALT